MRAVVCVLYVCLLSVSVSGQAVSSYDVISDSANAGYGDSLNNEPSVNVNVRDKRTLGFLLKVFGDAIGYDVQKRPSVLPIGPKPGLVPAAPAPAAPAAPPAAPAPPMMPAAPAPAPPAMPPARPAMPPARPAMPPARPAMPPARPAMPPARPAMPPARPAMPPARPAMPPARPAMPPARPAMPPAPAAPPMRPAPPAAPAPPMRPAAPPAAPAPPMRPAPAPAPPMRPAPPAAAPAPAPAQPKAPNLLTETVQKMFNINFSWNRNLQPPQAPAPPAAAPAPAGPLPKAPPAAPAPPQAPAAPAPVPAAPAPVPAAPAPVPAAPRPMKYEQVPLVQVQPNVYYQGTVDNGDQQPQQPIYYQNLENGNNIQQQQVQNSFPDSVQQFWQNSPWNRNNIKYPSPEFQQYFEPNGHGYHVQTHPNPQEQPVVLQADVGNNNEQQRYYYNSQQIIGDDNPEQQQQPQQQQQQQETQPEQEENSQQQDEDEEAPQRQQQEEENSEEDTDDSIQSSVYDNQPRGFKAANGNAQNQNGGESFNGGGYYQAGLPLAVHGIHEDKVLIAWPSPFELAGSEIKTKTVSPAEKALSEGGYNYQPESYGQYNFYEIPEPTKHDFGQYETHKDPETQDQLSKNAKITERKFGKKFTTVVADRNSYQL